MFLNVRGCKLFWGVLWALAALTGCGILDAIYPRPEFSVSGARIAVMPFKGPDQTWYGEHKSARELGLRTAWLLREGGATVIPSEKIAREVAVYDKEGAPPWVTYGKRLRVDYVLVGRLSTWEIGNPKAIGYSPGEAALRVEVYDVSEAKVTFSKALDASVGMRGSSGRVCDSDAEAKKELMKLLLKRINEIFVTGEKGL